MTNHKFASGGFTIHTATQHPLSVDPRTLFEQFPFFLHCFPLSYIWPKYRKGGAELPFLQKTKRFRVTFASSETNVQDSVFKRVTTQKNKYDGTFFQ